MIDVIYFSMKLGKKFQKGINNLIHNIVFQLTVLLFLNLHKWSLHCLPFCNFSFLHKIFVISLYLWIKMDPFISNCFHWSYNYHFKYPLNFFQFFYYSKQFCNGHSCSCLCAYIWGPYGSVLIDYWLIDCWCCLDTKTKNRLDIFISYLQTVFGSSCLRFTFSEVGYLSPRC